MHKIIFLLILITSLSILNADIEVISTGFGETVFQAKNDALRNAVEQGAGVKIFSQTEVKDFVALKDVLVSESFGLVTGYELLSRRNTGQGWEVKVKARVTKQVGKKWAKIKIILQQKGNPSIMFCIKEDYNGSPLSHPIGEYQLVNKFKNLGFKVIDRQWSQETKNLQQKLYSLDQNTQGITAVASKQGADLLVFGFFEGKFSKKMKFYGNMKLIMHNYIFRTKVVRTDTAQIVSAITKNYTTKHNDMAYSVESAGKEGFSKIVKDEYIQPMITDIVKTWIRDVQEGTEMELVISNVKFNKQEKITFTLRAQADLITAVRVKHYRNKRLFLEVKSKLKADELAKKLIRIPGLKLEVVELQKNKLELTVPKNQSYTTTNNNNNQYQPQYPPQYQQWTELDVVISNIDFSKQFKIISALKQNLGGEAKVGIKNYTPQSLELHIKAKLSIAKLFEKLQSLKLQIKKVEMQYGRKS